MKTIFSVEVEFESGLGGYSYKCFDPSIECGDLVVVEAKSFFAVAKVTNKIPSIHPKAVKWVVQRVDLEKFKDSKEKVVAKEVRIKELTRQLEFKSRQLAIETHYELLSKNDPEAAKLVKELKKLQGSL